MTETDAVLLPWRSLDRKTKVKYSYGWVFVHMTEETADEKLQEG